MFSFSRTIRRIAPRVVAGHSFGQRVWMAGQKVAAPVCSARVSQKSRFSVLTRLREQETGSIGGLGVKLTDSSASPDETASKKEPKEIPEDVPAYQMSFTCKQCSTRSTHRVTKQGYHHGTVLVKCPGCSNRHLISDHLKIFSDDRITIEDILGRKGETVLKRTIQPGDEDIEIWRKEEDDEK